MPFSDEGGGMTALVPALAEQNAAHIARMKRMGMHRPNVVSYDTVHRAPPPPMPIPTERTIKIPDPVGDLSGTRKHQIVVLSAAGYAPARIARRLKVSPGVVAGVLHRARAQEHRLLLGEVIAILFGLGFDTYEIAGLVGEPEHAIANGLSRARDRSRGQ